MSIKFQNFQFSIFKFKLKKKNLNPKREKGGIYNLYWWESFRIRIEIHTPLLHFNMPSPLLSSASILVLSPPDTQDVFHTPPEDSSLHSSDHNQRNLTLDDDSRTHGFVDSDTSEFLDFEKNSELGFSEAHFKHEIGADLIPENSHTVEGDEPREISERHYDEFEVSEREISDFEESPLKRLKSGSMGDSERGISDLDDSLGDSSDEEKLESPCNGMDCEQVNVDAVNEDDDFGREMSISMDKNLGSKENDEILVVESAKDVNLIEGIQSSDEVIEGSEMSKGGDKDPVVRKLPDSIRCLLEKGTDNESDSGMEVEKNKISVFEVLKFLSERTSVVLDEGENENYDSGVTLLEAAKVAGITFPRPRWLPEDYESEFFNFDDQNKDQRK